eukprot:m.233947 g.233947  ORF g.233947 m.233947 type:complete len:406 (+) comp12591_c0_seq1:19-1236(+)
MAALFTQRVLRAGPSRTLVRTIATTPEHKNVQDLVEKWIQTEINPNVTKWEDEGIFPAKKVFKSLGNLGLLGLTKPTKYGGMGLDYTYAIVMAEALGRIACGGVPMAVGVQTDMATPALAQFGSEELCKQFLTPTIAGDLVACIGVSEPFAGSDVSGIRTTARKDGGDYIINGSKLWITNGIQGDWICLLVNTSTGNPHKSKSLICVPLDAKGVTRVRKLDKLGMRCSDTAELHFEDVRVPQGNRIGEEGRGFVYQMLQFQEERLWAAASCLTTMEMCIQQTVEYTKTRVAFGKPILANQVVQFRLAELQTEIEALRSLVYRAAGLRVQGQDVTLLASMAKLKAGRLVREVADGCLQYWGGMGFVNETPITRVYRDQRILSIGGGADEVMLGIISKLMGVVPKEK